MIINFGHKALEAFYKTSSTQGIQATHTKRLKLILGLLDVADTPQAMKVPSFDLQTLEDELTSHCSVRVSNNWRISFCFTELGVELLDYQDYH